jgi:hypothetical protein
MHVHKYIVHTHIHTDTHLHPEESLALFVLTGPHLLELSKVLLNACVSPRTHAFLRHLRKMVDVRLLEDLATRLNL